MRLVFPIAGAAIVLALVMQHAALAQETIALAVEGWRTEEREGVTYYRCASQICAAGSVVSYKPQPHRTALTFAEFEPIIAVWPSTTPARTT